ncbi:nuclear transport factor 2 family protein [Nonomuraea sp. NPDC050680]|uniref:nuclear transport factor 2 family protein n=1 Tax=Nonomuraea sp. NPDC050680 TaxID=3154630 RepID=UPI0033FC43AE
MADLFAEDAVFEFPFQLPGAPQEEQGRETFRAHLKTGAQIQRFESVDNVAIRQTADPEVVIAEYRLQGLVTATGKRFTSQIVMVARVRDGLISWSRNYSNPLDSVIAFDMVDDLIAGLGRH